MADSNAISYVTPTIDSPFGEAVPLIVGKATVVGRMLYSSGLKVTGTISGQTTDANGVTTVTAAQASAATVDFVVAFGRADPLAQHTVITKLYADGVLFYDATGKTAIMLPGYGSVTLYTGNTTQTPDPMLSEVYDDLTPGFRGLIYASFRGYPVPQNNNGKLPQILAEVGQTNDPSALAQVLPAFTYADILFALYDKNASQLTYVARNGLQVYDVDTASMLYSLPLTDENGSPQSVQGSIGDVDYALSTVDDTYYYAIVQAATGGASHIVTINRLSNSIVGRSTTSSEPYLFGKIWAVPGSGRWTEYIVTAVGDVYGVAADHSLTFLRNLGFGPAFIAAQAPLGYIATWAQWPYHPPFSGTAIAAAVANRGPQIVSDEAFNANEGPSDAAPYVNLITAALGGDGSDQTNYGNPNTVNGYLTYTYAPGATAIAADLTTGAPSAPGKVCDVLDTSTFSVFYALSGDNKVRRVVLCDGQDVVFARRPPNFAPKGFWPVLRANLAAALLSGVAPAFGTGNGYDGLPKVRSPADAPATFSVPAPLQICTSTSGGTPIDARSGGDLVTIMADVSDAATKGFLRGIYCGPATDPFVAVVYHNNTDSKDYSRAFDTFWNRRPTNTDAPYQANYYLFQKEGSIKWKPYNTGNDGLKLYDTAAAANAAYPNVTAPSPVCVPVGMALCNPPMALAVRDFFAAYPDKAMPALVPFDNVNNPVGFELNKMQGKSQTFDYAGPDGVFYMVNMRSTAVSFSFGAGLTYKDAETGAVIANPLDPRSSIDADDGIIYTGLHNPPYLAYVNGGVAIGETTLDAVLRSLSVQAGYPQSLLNTSGLGTIAVRGAVINQAAVTFSQLLQALADTFRFDVFDTNGKINFVKKARNASFAYDDVIDQSDLIPLADTGDVTSGDDGTVLAFERAFSNDLPAIITLEYIDQDYACTVGTQTARRTIFPHRTVNGVQTQDNSVPIVMSANDAAFWANAALYDIWASATKVSLRMDQRAVKYDPGDFILLNLDDGTTLGLHVTQTTLNGDKSFSIEAITLTQYDTFAAPSGVPQYAQTQQLTKTVPPIFLCADNVLVYPGDDDGSGLAPYRWTADKAAALYVYNSKSYVLNTREPTGAVYGIVSKMLAALPDNYGPHYDAKAYFEFVPLSANKSPAPAASLDDVIAGRNVCFVGNAGRWEMLFYNAVFVGSNSIRITGLVRGRRGTDSVAARSHTGGDLVFFPPADWPILRFAANGGTGNVKAIPDGASGASTGTNATISPLGAPLAPWAPCGLAAAVVGSDIVITWERRTRTGSDLHDNDGQTPLDEASESYTLGLIDVSGSNVYYRSVTGARTFTYTAAAMLADGHATPPKTLYVAIGQIGAVGLGVTLGKLLTVKGA